MHMHTSDVDTDHRRVGEEALAYGGVRAEEAQLAHRVPVGKSVSKSVSK